MEAAIFILRSCASSCDCHVAGRQTIGRNALLVLTTHSTYFIIGYMASDIW